MARSFTRAQLRTRLEQLTDTEGDGHLGTSEKNAILNSAIAETYDLINSSGQGEKFTKRVTFNTVAGQTEYLFSAICSDGDFYRVAKVYADEGNGQYRALQPISPSNVLSFRAPTSAVPMVLYYVPSAPIIADNADSTSLDFLNGWEEHTLMCAAIAVKMKKMESYAPYEQRKMALEKRIKEMGNIDLGNPPRIVRKSRRYGSMYYPYFSQINAYVIRGDKLELYYSYPWVR